MLCYEVNDYFCCAYNQRLCFRKTYFPYEDTG